MTLGAENNNIVMEARSQHNKSLGVGKSSSLSGLASPYLVTVDSQGDEDVAASAASDVSTSTLEPRNSSEANEVATTDNDHVGTEWAHNESGELVRMHQATSAVKWPSELMRLMNQNGDDDEWGPVLARIHTHPHEIDIQGLQGGMNALHTACVRYAPLHIVRAMVEARPEAALVQNHSGDTPLQLASFSAGEDVQEVLIRAAPAAAALVDIYGDCPLHFAARAGASYQLIHLLLQAAPHMISHENKRGVTPFWLLPRSFLEANSLDDIFVSRRDDHLSSVSDDNDDDNETNSDDDDYQDDWDVVVLFLRFAYFGAHAIQSGEAPDASSHSSTNTQRNCTWLVAAAASTPSCPREVLRFFCRMFPNQALQYDMNGRTPLVCAARAPERCEPKNWDDTEDCVREYVEVSDGVLQNPDHVISPEEMTLSMGDAEFVRRSVLAKADEAEEDDPKESVLGILVEWSPRSASFADRAEGRLPLTHALWSGKSWRSTRAVVSACPRALEQRDPQTGFHMYQLAAMKAPQLGTVYNITRSLPDLLLLESGRDERFIPSLLASCANGSQPGSCGSPPIITTSSCGPNEQEPAQKKARLALNDEHERAFRAL